MFSILNQLPTKAIKSLFLLELFLANLRRITDFMKLILKRLKFRLLSFLPIIKANDFDENILTPF